MDAFSDFVTVVVPEVGQEIATWKFDVRRKERKLTVFRLSYEDDMAAVADYLSLQFHSESSDPSAYSLIPTLCTGGHKQEPAFVQNILGKSRLNSALDIHTLLTYLDRSNNFDVNTGTPDSYSYITDGVDAVAEPLCGFESEGSVDTPFDSYDGEESEHSWEATEKRKVNYRLPKRRSKRSGESPAEKSPKRRRKSRNANTSEGGENISNGKCSSNIRK